MKQRVLAGGLLACVACVACASQTNTLAHAERSAGWRLLFDGKTFAGWRGVGLDSVPTAHWHIKDGAIMKVALADVPNAVNGKTATGGDLMSIDTFENFELTWEFKLTPKANTGVKYNVSEELSTRNPGSHSALGWEFQLQDDVNGDDITIPSHLTGSLYDMLAANARHLIKPVGTWNSARLVFNGNKGEHWLNGHKVIEFDIATPEFSRLFAKSKYKNIAGFAVRRRGHVVLQDHNDEVYFRNIKLCEYPRAMH
ncbi:MAG: DUF1080 domain-containing protein [Gemmatimonadota bacterium]|nr:DUF1080 domain-containing protein [Gemmatimonadota bacterium]